MMRLTAQVHDSSYQSYVYEIYKISAARLFIFVFIAYATDIDFTHTMFFQFFYGMLIVTFPDIPKISEIIHDTIGNNAKRDAIAHGRINLHQTIHGIIKSRVATYKNYCLIAIVYHHLDKTIHASGVFALHVVIIYIFCCKNIFYSLPSLMWMKSTVLGTIDNAPAHTIYHI